MDPVNEAKHTAAVDLGDLLDAGDGAVVTLVAGDTHLVAHRAVLAARSPVFEAMFHHDMQEASSSQVEIPDVEGPVLRQLLAYCYTLQAPQLPDMAPQLLAAADKYCMSVLKTKCEQQVLTQLDIETAAAAAVLAVRHSCSSLRQAAIAFIKDHTHQVLATQGWTDAMRNQIEDVVEVTRLIADPPPRTSAPASAGSGTTPTTQPHSDLSRTAASAAPPTADRPTPPPDDAAVSQLRAPAGAGSGTKPTTQLHSDVSQTAASAAPPTAAHCTPPPEDASISQLRAPASAGSGTKPTTQLHSDVSQTAASAAPPTAAHCTPPPEDASISQLRGVSADQKERRLLQAAFEGDLAELQALLSAGADGEARDDYLSTALHWAAYKGHADVARCLVEAGSAVDARDNKQGTPLHSAAYGGHVAVVELLLAASADTNARNDRQWTPLHFAAQDGHVAVVELLLAASADPNARDDCRWTPLHLAAQNGHADVAAVLLRAGADRGARTNMGNTPLDIARHKNKRQLIEILT